MQRTGRGAARAGSRRRWTATAVALLIAGCRPSPEPATPDPGTAAAPGTASSIGPGLEIASLESGVWMHTSWREFAGGQRFPSHGLVVAGAAETVLIDTAWGAEPTRLLLDWLDTELGLEIDRAVITHFHDDRMGGSGELAARGIPFSGHPRTAELGRGGPSPVPAPFSGLGVGKARPFGPVEVFNPGPAHTADNLMVWLPAPKILFGGCAVRPLAATSLGNVADADLAGWPTAIRRALDRYPAAVVVVPSHGPPGGGDLLLHTLRLLEEAQ